MVRWTRVASTAWRRLHTTGRRGRALFIWWIIVRSRIDDSSSFEREIILFTMKFLMPVRCPSGNIFHLVLIASSSAMRPKYRPCGNELFSMIWSAACQQPGFSLSFMRISFAVARSGCLGSYAAATMPSSTATSKGWSSCSRRWPASATLVVMVASRLRRATLCARKRFLAYLRGALLSRPTDAARVSAQSSSALVRLSSPARHARGKSSTTKMSAAGGLILVCRCTSSHDRRSGRRFSSASPAARTAREQQEAAELR